MKRERDLREFITDLPDSRERSKFIDKLRAKKHRPQFNWRKILEDPARCGSTRVVIEAAK